MYPPLKYRHLWNKTQQLLKQHFVTLRKSLGREVQTLGNSNISLVHLKHELKGAGKEHVRMHDERCSSSSYFSLAHYHIQTKYPVREQ